MAYTVDFSSGTGVQGVADDIYFQVRDTTNYAEPKYRYLCKLTIDSVVVGTFKQLPNNLNCAVFRVQDIVSDYVHQDEQILRLGEYNSSNALSTTTIFSTNQTALQTVTVDFGYEYAATADDAPTQTFDGGLQTTFKAINGSIRPFTVNSNDSNSASVFAITGDTKLFLSTVPLPSASLAVQNVIEGQYGALAFLNGDDVGSNDSDYVHVTFKNSSDATINTGYFTNNSTYGGYAPAASLEDSQSLLYLGCFPENLEKQNIDTDLRPSNNTNWSYYEVQFARSTTLSGNESSAVYKFVKLCDTRYNNSLSTDTFRGEYFLSWWNELGGIDNLLCDGGSLVTQQVTRNNYRTVGGNTFSASSLLEYSRDAQEGGLISATNQTVTTVQLNTREENPEVINSLIMSLVNSPRVYVYSTAFQQSAVLGKTKNWLRCVVTDTSVSYKTALNNKVDNYTINIEISRRKPNVK